MRATIIGAAALLLVGCAGPTDDSADEALAEAQRANDRIDDLDAELASLRDEMENEQSDLRAAIENETGERETSTSNVEAALADVEYRVGY